MKYIGLAIVLIATISIDKMLGINDAVIAIGCVIASSVYILGIIK